MPIVNRYRLFCQTDEHVYVWAGENDPVPNKCPINTEHLIDENLTTIVESEGQEQTVREADGAALIAHTYGQFQEDASFKGVLLDAPAEQTTFQDLQITTQVFMQGGYFWSCYCNKGDYVEVSVIDKDDVLGLFALYGLTVGQDVLELGKFVTTQYMRPGGVEFAQLHTEDIAPVVPGLYIRAKYENVGPNAAVLGVTYHWFEE